jgi:hypothetical protein
MNQQIADLFAIESIADEFRQIQIWFLVGIFCFIGAVIVWGMIKHRA